MGLTCRVSSPTFTIVNEYLGKRELIHFDTARAPSDELPDIGWEDYLAGAVCAGNGAKREDAFFGDEITVRIEKLSRKWAQNPWRQETC